MATKMEQLVKNKNYVFISYNHKDVKWAQWLQKKLEWYKLPTEVHNEYSDSRYIRPVFRDRDTLTSGVLNDELRSHLEASKFLVVICSPNSAQSDWVSDEVKAFIEMGRLDRIVPFIVEGRPQDYGQADIAHPLMGECFPLALRKWNTEHPERNLLGISVTDDGKNNRQKAFIRLVAHLLGVDFDILWQRHKRYIRRIYSLLSVLSLAIVALAYWFMVPIKVSISIKDDPSRLPGMEHGVLMLNGSEYSFSRPDTTIEIGALPGYNKLRLLPMSLFIDRFYVNEEGSLKIGIGFRQHTIVQLHRDSTFAFFAGRVLNASAQDYATSPVAHAEVIVDGRKAFTDEDGAFCFIFPLEEQSETKEITISKDGFWTLTREDECPSRDLLYLLHRQ